VHESTFNKRLYHIHQNVVDEDVDHIRPGRTYSDINLRAGIV
jgi:hypothetical protein